MASKIGIIGAGNVGGATASLIALKGLADVVLVETVQREGTAKGKALDITQSCALSGSNVTVTGSAAFHDLSGAAVCIVTAGLPRSPGMSREDLIGSNAAIITEIAEKIRYYTPECIVIVVSNPVDSMAFLMQQSCGFRHQRVIGMAGVLDSARLRSNIAASTQCCIKDIQTMVLGGHGDTMVPLIRYCTINGVPVNQLLDIPVIEHIVKLTRFGGGDIVALMGTSAYYAAAASIVEMIESIVLNQHRIMPCSVYTSGEYGLTGLYIGLPVRLGSSGVEQILEIQLDEYESGLLKESAGMIEQAQKVMLACLSGRTTLA